MCKIKKMNVWRLINKKINKLIIKLFAMSITTLMLK